MFKNIVTFSLLFIMVFSLVPHSVVSASNNGLKSTGEKVPNQYIVILKEDSSPEIVANEARGKGAEVLHVYDNAVKGFAARVSNALALDDIKNDPRVAYIEQDQVVTAFAQNAVESFAQILPTGVDRADADISSTTAGDGAGSVDVNIAIIDTGIDLTHPDLNVYKQKSFVKSVKTANDDNGHGSHVAGIAAAKDNGIGVVGIAPGAKLWAVKVLSRSGSGSISDVIAGINYVTQNAGEIGVANMSLGCQCSSSALDTAIHNSVLAGVTYVVAAGNSATDASTFSPANHPDVIAVSAIVDTDGKCGGLGTSTSYGNDDTFASFSNFGSTVDIAAPGVKIYSTYKGGSFATLSGTSMASPHVAGAAALYESTHSGASPADIKTALTGSGSMPSTTCDGKGHGYFTGDTDGISEPLLYTAGY